MVLLEVKTPWSPKKLYCGCQEESALQKLQVLDRTAILDSFV